MQNKLKAFKALRMLKNVVGESFSTNIYAELSVDNLRKEYNKTVLELMDYSVDKHQKLLFQNPLNKNYMAYFREKLVKKMGGIKAILKGHIKTRGLRPGLNEDRYCGWLEENQINSEMEEIEEEEQYQNMT